MTCDNLTCDNQAEMIVVIGGPGRIKDNAAAKNLAAQHRCGKSYGRYGFVCSLSCAVVRAWYY